MYHRRTPQPNAQPNDQFGQPPRLRFLPWEEWRHTVPAADAWIGTDVPAALDSLRQSFPATLFDAKGGQILTHFLSPNPSENATPRAAWQHSRDTSAVWAAGTRWCGRRRRGQAHC